MPSGDAGSTQATPPPPMDEEARRIERASAAIQSSMVKAQADYNAAIAESRSRSLIASVVVGIWATSILAYAAACFIVLFRASVQDAATAQAAVTNISELVKVAVLPLTAIVVGYYLSRN